jgi:hypothetical protein
MFQAKREYCPVCCVVLLYSLVYGLNMSVLLALLSRCWTVFLSETWTLKISSWSFLWHFVRDLKLTYLCKISHWCRVNLHIQHKEDLARAATELLNLTILHYLSFTHLTSVRVNKFCIWCFHSGVSLILTLHTVLFTWTLQNTVTFQLRDT